MSLSQLNPFGSLFGRLFIWFWITLIIIFAASFILGKEIQSERQLTVVPKRHKNEIANVVRRLESSVGSSAQTLSNTEIKKRLGRIGSRHNSPSLLIDKTNGDIIYGFKRSRRLAAGRFRELADESSVYGFKMGDLVFFGPTPMTLNDRSYALFVGKPLTPSLMRRLYRRNPALMIPFAILISGVLCFWLSWTLVKPLRQLQKSTQQMAAGDLSASVGSAAERSDEIGKLSRDFNYMSAQVHALVEGQKRLLGDISHELRSPLARLLLAIGIAQQNREDSQQANDEHLDRVEKEAHLIEQMIADVLKLSRAQSANALINKCRVDISQLVQECTDNARFEAKVEGKCVAYDKPPPINLEADPGLLSSAVENLVRNAIKYAELNIQVTLEQTNGIINIIIIDDGPGIADAELSAIFKPFYRLSESRTRESGGVGLGLAIAQQAVLAHNGEIEAKNNIDSTGLTVTIRLPISTLA
jgi:two-component system sensor histidine kinase CpxA